MGLFGYPRGWHVYDHMLCAYQHLRLCHARKEANLEFILQRMGIPTTTDDALTASATGTYLKLHRSTTTSFPLTRLKWFKRRCLESLGISSLGSKQSGRTDNRPSSFALSNMELLHPLPRRVSCSLGFPVPSPGPLATACLLCCSTGAPARDPYHLARCQGAVWRGNNEVRKFNSRKEADAFLTQGESAGYLPFLQPDADIFTNSSAFLRSRVGNTRRPPWLFAGSILEPFHF